MKKTIKLLLPIIICLLFIPTVNAKKGFECKGEIVKVTETDDAAPAGYDVRLPVCQWEKVIPEKWKVMGEASASLDDQISTAEETFKVTNLTTDEKGFNTLTMPRCKLDEAKVDYSASCKFQLSFSTTTSSEDLCRLGCSAAGGYNYVAYIPYSGRCLCRKLTTGSTTGTVLLKEYKSSYSNLKSSTSIANAFPDMRPQGYENAFPYDCSVSFTLKCPIYKCKREIWNVNACTPTYKTKSGDDAYCVNPSHPFSVVGNRTVDYQIDKDFDVTKCVNSYSTPDCGYANILIEGSLKKVCSQAINLALRLWGYHSGQSGYDKTGLSRMTGSGCSSYAPFMVTEGGSYVNVYRETHKYIMETLANKFYEVAKGIEYIDPREEYFTKIKCSESLPLGVACESKTGASCGKSKTSVSQTAFNLFFNTVIGNKHMQENLNTLIGGTGDLRPTDATLIQVDKDTYETEIHFQEITRSEEKNVVVDCKELAKNPNDPNYNSIMPYCQVKVSLVDDHGNPITEPTKIQECVKGEGCKTRIDNIAICDWIKEHGEDVSIKIQYEIEKEVTTKFKKLTSCTDTRNQVLFSIDIDGDSSSSSSGKTTPKSETVTRTELYKIDKYFCGKEEGFCDRTDVRTNINKCDVNGTYNKTLESSIKDPSLSCIVNMATQNKQQYDYTDYYGLNSNICRVYCSDEINYKLPSKTKLDSGLSFRYDIELKGYANPDKKLFSNVVEEKRSCVTEIYYINNFPESSKRAIQKQYGFKDSDMANINNWTQLFTALATKSTSQRNRKENLYEIIYDLYNCNLFSKIDAVPRPKDKIVKSDSKTFYTAYQFIKYINNEANNYGIGKTVAVKDDNKVTYEKCNLTDPKKPNTCITVNSITYEGGAEVYGKVGATEELTTRVGNGETIDVNYNYYGETIDKVKYCSGNSCLVFEGLEKEDYTQKKFTTTASNMGSVTIGGKNIPIPTNDYAYFYTLVRVGTYNNSEFVVYPQTGYVTKQADKAAEKLISLAKYVYPMSKNAYIVCKNGSKDLHHCSTSQKFANINTFYRKVDNDKYIQEIEKNKEFGCFVDVEPPKVILCSGAACDPDSDSYTIYRNVDLDKLFTVDRSDKNTNWTTDRGKEVTEAIEEAGSGILLDDEYLEYSIKLTPEQMLAIREQYNTNNYINDSTILDTCDIEDGKYFNCKSEFLEMLRANTKEKNYLYGELVEEYSTGVSKHNTPKEKVIEKE